MKDSRKHTINNTDEWKEALRNRAKVVNSAASRSRYTLIFVALVSIGLSLVMFAYFYSWNKKFAYKYKDEHKKGIVQEDIIRDGVIKEWQSTQTYQLPLLGLKIMASDLPLFAPLAMIIVTTWLYFVSRREHFSLGRLLSDAYFVFKDKVQKKNPESIIFCQELYHLVIGHTIFNVIPYDRPISNLSEIMVSAANIKKKPLLILSRYTVIVIIVYLPLLSIIFIGIVRLLTFITTKSSITNSVHVFSELMPFRKLLIILSAISMLLGILFCFYNAKKILQFARSSRTLLDDYQKWAFHDLEQLQPTKNIVHMADGAKNEYDSKNKHSSN